MGFIGCLLKTLLYISIVATLIVFIPNLPPYAEISKSVRLTKPMELVGRLAPNEKLKDIQIWHKGDLSGPEAFADYNGELYTGLNGGNIVKFVRDKIELVAKTGKPCKGYYEEHICGRPLGMEFDKNGNLIVADAYYGILKVNVKTGNVEVLVSPDIEIDGKKPKLFNSVAVASNGDIYWTDSSAQFKLYDLMFDTLSDPSGRLIHYDAKTKKNKVLIDRLLFANGVKLLDNEGIVLVAETVCSRLYRYYLKGPKKGTSDIFIESIPGIVDNINSDGNSGILLSLIESIDSDHPSPVQMLLPFPLLRRFIVRSFGLIEYSLITLNSFYPSEFLQKGIHFIGHYSTVVGKFGHFRTSVIRISKTGEIIDSYHSTSKKLSFYSEVYIFKDKVYFGSPLNDYVGVLPVEALGLEKQEDKPSTEKNQATVPKAKASSIPLSTQPPKPTPVPTQAPTAKPTNAPTPKEPSTPKPTQAPTTATTPIPSQEPAPKPTPAPTPKRAPAPTPKPVQAATPRPAPSPTPKSAQTVTQKPAPAPTPKPAQATTPKPAQATTPKPAQATTPKPASAPTPKSAQTSTPKPAATPKPTPSTTPKPAPAPTPRPEQEASLKPTTAPKSKSAPTATPKSAPAVAPTPKPVPASTPKPNKGETLSKKSV